MGALGVKAGVLAILVSRKREREVERFDDRQFLQDAIYTLENPPFRLVHYLRSLVGGLLQEPVGERA